MLDSIEIKMHLISLGFKPLKNQSEKRKVDGFINSHLASTVYVKRDPDDPLNPKTRLPLVIHDRHERKIEQVVTKNPGVLTGTKRYYFNSNLKGFNKKLNNGTKEEAYGIHLNIADKQALVDLINSLSNSGNVSFDIVPNDTDISSQSNVDQRTLQAIKTRRGQPAFRKALLAAYNGTCCISGCKVEAVLEAAHIVPHGEETNYSVTNGLILRADIHTLFDLKLFNIDDSGYVEIESTLNGTDYEKYHGLQLMGGQLPTQMLENLKKRKTFPK